MKLFLVQIPYIRGRLLGFWCIVAGRNVMMKIDFLFCVYIILTHCATVKDYFNENCKAFSWSGIASVAYSEGTHFQWLRHTFWWLMFSWLSSASIDKCGQESQIRLQLPHSTFIAVLVYELLHHSKLCSQCNLQYCKKPTNKYVNLLKL